MKLTFNWLKEFVEFKESPQRIAQRLTMAGLEVESLVPVELGDRDGADWLMEMAVTPNRGDCLGILGLARELAALTGGRLKSPPASSHRDRSNGQRLVRLEIRNPRLCPRYSARVIGEIRVAPSPAWMRARIEACGVRSINNVVDITNYVMLETGQPLHAFDLGRLTTRRIVVRTAGERTRFVTLDGIERELVPQDLLICDGDTPVALAGVMGGMHSQVQTDTRSVLLESANFDPLSVRRTARRLGLHSEASHRFERGVDPEGTIRALDRAAFLLGQVAGGAPANGVVDRYPRPVKPVPILLRSEGVKRLLGLELKRSDVEKILKSLGIKIQSRSRSALRVVPPPYRRDLTREADLVEELARLHSYERIPSTLPRVRPQSKRDFQLHWERAVPSFLVGEGLTGVVNLPFTSEQMNRCFSGLWEDRESPVLLLNPLAQENSEMRLSLIPGLVENLRAHVSRKVKSLRAFEMGKVFSLSAKGSPQERQHLAVLLYGQRERKGLQTKESPVTFLEAKGVLEGILAVLGLGPQAVWTSHPSASFLHPGKAAAIQLGSSGIGALGEIHPDLREELELPPFLVFELDFGRMVQYAPRELKVRSLPRFPSVERDLALVVDEEFPAQRIIDWVRDLNHSLIEDVQVFDQYRGAPIPDGKKSLAYTISYRAEDRTLTDAEVKTLHEELIARIGAVFGAELRG
jgi:phenylalanyl-tRNA synthetase beta chain